MVRSTWSFASRSPNDLLIPLASSTVRDPCGAASSPYAAPSEDLLVSTTSRLLQLLAYFAVDSFDEEVGLCVDVGGGPCRAGLNAELAGVVVDGSRENLDLSALQVGDRLLKLGRDVSRDVRVEGSDRDEA